LVITQKSLSGSTIKPRSSHKRAGPMDPNWIWITTTGSIPLAGSPSLPFPVDLRAGRNCRDTHCHTHRPGRTFISAPANFIVAHTGAHKCTRVTRRMNSPRALRRCVLPLSRTVATVNRERNESDANDFSISCHRNSHQPLPSASASSFPPRIGSRAPNSAHCARYLVAGRCIDTSCTSVINMFLSRIVSRPRVSHTCATATA